MESVVSAVLGSQCGSPNSRISSSTAAILSSADSHAASAAAEASHAQSAAGTIARKRRSSAILTVMACPITRTSAKGVSQSRVHITTQTSKTMSVDFSSRHTSRSPTGRSNGLRMPAASIVRWIASMKVTGLRWR